MVQDITGRGRTVFYAFTRRETAPAFDHMLETFVSFVEDASSTQCVMVDKDESEIAAVKTHLPHATVLLCTFHVLKSFKSKICEQVITVAEKEEIFRLMRKITYASQETFDNLIEEVRVNYCAINPSNVTLHVFIVS
jgi:zinc finger SWIM domain-containing protein 3